MKLEDLRSETHRKVEARMRVLAECQLAQASDLVRRKEVSDKRNAAAGLTESVIWRIFLAQLRDAVNVALDGPIDE